MDAKLLEIIGGSVFTITLVIQLLKLCASISSWEWDNKLMDGIENIMKPFFSRANK